MENKEIERQTKSLNNMMYALEWIINLCLLSTVGGLVTCIWLGMVGFKIAVSAIIIWVPSQILWRQAKSDIEILKEHEDSKEMNR